jgi:hypothetical protein
MAARATRVFATAWCGERFGEAGQQNPGNKKAASQRLFQVFAIAINADAP